MLYLPIGLLYASMPVGMLLTLVFQIYHTWTGFRDRKAARPVHTDGGDPAP